MSRPLLLERDTPVPLTGGFVRVCVGVSVSADFWDVLIADVWRAVGVPTSMGRYTYILSHTHTR